jgi:pyruvate dehydrogenase E2 component (dihydrolipoamide acetyltransferase)
VITPVVMPQLGLEVTEGTVAAIHVAVGAQVTEGDPVLEVETNKALSDVVAPRDGVVRAIEVAVGDTVAIGATLAVIADTADEPLDGAVDAVAPAVEEPEVAAAREAEPAAAAPGARAGQARTADGRLRAAPVARRAAARLGVDLERVDGTGPRGRITLRDVERVAGAGARTHGTEPSRNGHAAAPPVEPSRPAPERAPAGERIEVMTPMRRAIARRMAQSQQIPQFTLTREVDASWLLAEKDLVGGVGVGVNDLLLQAMAEVTLRHTALAASYTETPDGAPALRHRDGADLGLAVATARGLAVPVIRAAHDRSLAQIAAERARLVGDARSGRLRQEDMSGATMTLSNLARFGVDHFTAMLNPGETAILAVGRVVERLVPRGRTIAVVPTLTLSMTIDHRAADGAAGAAALVELAELLEGGMLWRT